MTTLPSTEPIYGVITVRLQSSRLPRKCLLEFGEGTVLDHVIRRTRHFGLQPIISTSSSPADAPIVKLAERHEVPCFRGSEEDKLQRWHDTCEAFGVRQFHTIDADDPFLDGNLALQSMALLTNSGYDAVYPSETSYLASVGYSLTADIVRRACALKTTTDTEMMWYHIERVPNFRKTALQTPGARIREVRLTLDYEEDYWLLRTVLRLLGPMATMAEIEALFLQNPALRDVNWFRNEAWQQRQLAKAL